ncbi:hypothetical protein WMY93_030574 [Mugilogobius chulae]|uniref:Uncharacterized protein n=1 Tax=Mugilogobius chulae TaxID=88201 RepID=A0AAW0MDY6_9GOBI
MKKVAAYNPEITPEAGVRCSFSVGCVNSHVKPDVVVGEKTASGPERHGIKAGLSGLRTIKLTADTMKVAVLLLLLHLVGFCSANCAGKPTTIKLGRVLLWKSVYWDYSGKPDLYVTIWDGKKKIGSSPIKYGHTFTYNHDIKIKKLKGPLTVTLIDYVGRFVVLLMNQMCEPNAEIPGLID